jgi:histidine triad (HIT) family protein
VSSDVIDTAASCTFCRIAQGGLAAHVVDQTGDFVAFLDHRPLFVGHTLLLPRTHYETLMDVPADLVGPLFVRAQRIGSAIERGLGADGVFVAINNRVSQSVPHLHVHLVPRRRKDGLKGFFWPRQKYAGEEDMARVRDAIAQAIAG